LKACWLLGDVEVNRCSREDSGYRQRKLSYHLFSFDTTQPVPLWRQQVGLSAADPSRRTNFATSMTTLERGGPNALGFVSPALLDHHYDR
jgi:hypothetical protein